MPWTTYVCWRCRQRVTYPRVYAWRKHRVCRECQDYLQLVAVPGHRLKEA